MVWVQKFHQHTFGCFLAILSSDTSPFFFISGLSFSTLLKRYFYLLLMLHNIQATLTILIYKYNSILHGTCKTIQNIINQSPNKKVCLWQVSWYTINSVVFDKSIWSTHLITENLDLTISSVNWINIFLVLKCINLDMEG